MKDEQTRERELLHQVKAMQDRLNELETMEARLELSKDALRAQEKVYHALIESMEDAYFEVDLAGNLTYVNEAFCTILGYSRSELLGLNNRAYTTPETAKAMYKIFNNVYRTGKSADKKDYEIFTKDGRSKSIELTPYLIRDSSDRPSGFRGVARDVTPRKQAERNIKESETRYRIIFETTGTGMIIVEDDMTISMVNREFERISGYGKEELEGKRWTEFIGSHDLERLTRFHTLRRIRPDTVPRSYEFSFIGKKGNEINVVTTVSLIPGTKRSVVSFLDITEHKRLDRELEESEKKYRLLAENVSDVIWITDLNLRFTYVSPSVERLLGFTVNELIGQPAEKVLSRNSSVIARQVLKEAMTRDAGQQHADSNARTLELEHVTNKGDIFLAEVKVNFSYDPVGQCVGILGISRDITQRKMAERALRKSEEHYRTIVEDQTELLSRWHPERKISFVNDVYCNYFGEKRENILGKGFFHHIYEEDRKQLVTYIASLGPENPVSTIEHRVLDRNGEVRWLQWTDRAITDASGNLMEIQSVGRDITKQKRAEEALKESERRLADIINFLPDATLAINLEGKVMAWNRAIEEMTGVKASNMVGKDNYEYALPFYGYRRPILADLVLMSDEEIERHYVFLRKEKDVLIVETDVPRVKGQNLFMWAKASPIYDLTGNVVGAIESIRDITDRKMAEEALQESERHLQALSSQLLTAQEDERRRLAQELHDSIGQMLTTVKYGIESTVNLMNENDTPSIIRTLESIIPVAQNGIEEVRRICTDLWPSILDDLGLLATVSWFCREYQKIYRDIFVEHRIRVGENEIPDFLKIVIYRVLQEAFNNIAKHSGADHITISLEKKMDRMELFIEDNGRGFDVKMKLSGTNTKRGLGLASIKERIKLSGGVLQVDSKIGMGTTVRASWIIRT